MLRLIAIPLLIAITLGIVAASVADTETDSVQTLTQFERFYIHDQTSPPVESANWEAVTLKDTWNLRQRLQHQEAWYKTHFTYTEQESDKAIFVPRISANASFWLNGVEIGNTGSFSEPLSRNWNYPVLISIPPQLIRTDVNELAIRLKVEPELSGFLFEIYTGPKSLLEARYNQSYFLKITAAKILSTIMALAALIVLTFYFTVKLPRSYLWFALGTVFWVTFSAVFFVRNPPQTLVLWETFCSLALFTALIFYYKCAASILNWRMTVFGKILWLLLALQIVGYLVLPNVLAIVLRQSVLVVSIVLIICLGFILLLQSTRPANQHRLWLGLTGLSVVGFASYDTIMAQLQITREFAKFPYLPLLAMIGGASIFIRQLIQQVQASQQLQHHRSEIESVARADALKNERQRLMQEIHDGVGGQLVSTLARLEKSGTADTEIVETLRTSIDDLRLIVHSLDSLTQFGDVVTLLATIRERMERNLLQQGIQINWQVEPVPAVDNFSSEQALQLLRIVQEAITNVVKHAGASVISLRCYPDNKANSSGVTVQIHDNGRGFNSQTTSVGLGLRNMRERAAKLKGNLSLQSDASGTSVEIWLPLHLQTITAQAV